MGVAGGARRAARRGRAPPAAPAPAPAAAAAPAPWAEAIGRLRAPAARPPPIALAEAIGAPRRRSAGGESPVRRDVASLVFRKHDTSRSGELSDAELRALCETMEHPMDGDGRLALFRKLVDVDGDGRVTRADFATWWRDGGEGRWDWVDGGAAREARLQSLADFFDGFDRRREGSLGGDDLARLHRSLHDHGHTNKPLANFLADAECDDGWLTFWQLYRWYFRESEDRPPPSPPSLGELKRSEDQRGVQEFQRLWYGINRRQELQAMKERAGRRLAGVTE